MYLNGLSDAASTRSSNKSKSLDVDGVSEGLLGGLPADSLALAFDGVGSIVLVGLHIVGVPHDRIMGDALRASCYKNSSIKAKTMLCEVVTVVNYAQNVKNIRFMHL